jgi:hypothetical protein
VDRHGGDLIASHLLCAGPLGRALLLQFFARHVDQVARVVVKVSTDEMPELWGTDMQLSIEGRVANPTDNAPMVRVLDVEALAGTPVGPGAITIEIPDDELIGGVWQLESAGGALTVAKGSAPSVTLSVAGFSALVYGVLDPIEVVTRGLGEVPAEAVATLSTMFPREMPYLVADF